jgi:DNA-binding CsgD family transcriptional regulator
MYLFNDEPTVEELLRDETARLLMARDGLSDNIVRALVRDVQRRLRSRRDALAAAYAERAA